MPFARSFSTAFVGLEAVPIEIEVDISNADMSTTSIVGLPDTAVRESKDRVWAALKNSGYQPTLEKCTINLAPANLKKEGAYYDLPIAFCLLQALGALKTDDLEEYLIIGELGLDGQVRPIHGALAAALLAQKSHKRGIILPAANAQEAAVITDIDVIPIHSLQEGVEFFKNPPYHHSRFSDTLRFLLFSKCALN